MNTYKVTFYFSAGSFGWTESYWVQGSSFTYACQQLVKLCNLRMAMYYQYVALAGVRVSQVGAQRSSFLLLPGENNLGDQIGFFTLPFIGTYISAIVDETSDQVRVALQARCVFNGGYKSIRYFVGCPEAIGYPTTGGLIPNAHMKWYQLWIAFKTELLATHWGVMARSTVPPYKPSVMGSLTVGGSTGNLLGVVIPNAAVPPNVPPGSVQISRCRPPKGTRELSLNGTWMVDSITTSTTPPSITVFLAGSAGVLPSSVRLTPKSTLQFINPIFYPFNAVNALRVGIHKRGRPSLAPRGRQLKRLTLDP